MKVKESLLRYRAVTVTLIDVVRTSETSVCSNETTLHYIPEGSHRHTRRRDNLKSHICEGDLFCKVTTNVRHSREICVSFRFGSHSKWAM
jgi:hypothetical protein